MSDIVNLQFKNKLPKPGKTGLDWYVFCEILEIYKNKPMLEIGVGNGGSLYTICSYSDNVWAVDNWKYGWDKTPVEQACKSLDCNVTFVDIASSDVKPVDFPIFDFVHLDANKGQDETFADLNLVAKMCFGIICVDDYMNSVWPEVTWAVDKFIDESPEWQKLLIGNHQIFLCKKNNNLMKHLIDLPLVLRNNIYYITYGDLPKDAQLFVDNGKMTYTWHNLVWNSQNKDLL